MSEQFTRSKDQSPLTMSSFSWLATVVALLGLLARPSECTRAFFVFGDSLVDNGNNNFLNGSGVRADYLPYGVDFPLGPSGRFSNGRNVIDALGELLRLPGLVPPFADPRTRGRAALHGVNFASGGSGILDHTGQLTVSRSVH